MELEKSRNGFYTITFINKNNVSEEEIRETFQTVGHVVKVIKNFQRVFIRFREREEAEKAIIKFGDVLDVHMAKNSDNQSDYGGKVKTKTNHKKDSLSSVPNSPESMDRAPTTQCTINQGFHLILTNLPKNYTIRDVNALIEEAKPVYINDLGESMVFQIKTFHIILSSCENLSYLINKLDGFMICGQKLQAIEGKNLLEWRNRET